MPNPFEKLLKWNPRTVFAKKRVLGIDIGASAIKVIELEKDGGGRALLKNYGELALGPYSPEGVVGQATNLSLEKISQALQDVFHETGIIPHAGAIAFPLGPSFLLVIELPNADRRQVETMIPFEARKYIPVPAAEVQLGWQIIPEKSSALAAANAPDQKEKKIEVLLAAVHNDTIAKYKEIAKRVGLENASYEIEVFSAIRSVIGRDTSPLMILDMGAATTKLAMVEWGIIHSSHIINMGSQDITNALSTGLSIPKGEAEQAKRDYGLAGMPNDPHFAEAITLPLGQIFSDASRVLSNYERRYNKKTSKVILTGGGVMLKGLLEFAQKNFDTDVVMGNPFERVETPAFMETTLKDAGPEFAVAIGLGLKALQEG
ncbi:MAG: hypothetical protein A2591_00760 [Candidatus Yonathbacteria bacterium RIFOXYD1_FULL_52_36]|uniref:SHS2 domain-containing protein n=1 Tax=Candidatus Yonathbacteria bacterium RIFOXYD1_FULL_52_36 TaxID=1802730 RepID=A0A1G2SJI4_9BACT|nr:MAG: hypothetical protein A2591_00760 [Candidatus Yonathbacteria bacterium RIFOXYD1_FULL_52_36]